MSSVVDSLWGLLDRIPRCSPRTASDIQAMHVMRAHKHNIRVQAHARDAASQNPNGSASGQPTRLNGRR